MRISHEHSDQTKGMNDASQSFHTQNEGVELQKTPSSIASSPSLIKAIEREQVPSVSSKTRNIEIIKLEKYSDFHTLDESYSFIKKKLKREMIKVFASQIAKDYPGLIHQSDRIAHSIYKTFAQGEQKVVPPNDDSEKLAMIDRKLLKEMKKRVHDMEGFHPTTKEGLIAFVTEQLTQIESERKPTGNQAATTIQRTFRKYQFRKKVKERESDPQIKAKLIGDIKTAMLEGWIVKINPSPAKPFRKNQIEPEKVEAYLKTQPQERREVLEKVLKSSIIKNISFEKFEQALTHSINDFLEYLGSLPKEERGYVVVADKPGKSTNWVFSLCAPQLVHQPPQEVMQNVHLEQHLDYQVNHTTSPVRHILMIDDGSYSGEQLARYLNEMVIPAIEKTKQPLTIHLVVPFMTEYAKKGILKQQKGDIPIRISEHQMMISIADLPKYLKKLSEEDLVKLRQIISEDMKEKHISYVKNIDKPIESRTLTYFEHKLADFASTADWIFEAIIAQTPTIYKPEELENMIYALESTENQQALANINKDLPRCISFITTDKGAHLYVKDASPEMKVQKVDLNKEGVVSITHAADQREEVLFIGDLIKLEEGDFLAFNPYAETATFLHGQLVKNQSEES